MATVGGVTIPGMSQNNPWLRNAAGRSVGSHPAGPGTPAYAAGKAPSLADIKAGMNYGAQVQGYQDEYNRQMAAARAGIEGTFGSALSDIGAREGLTNQALGLLPGQIGGIYDPIKTGMVATGGRLDKAQAKAGIQSYAPASDQMAPGLQALAAARGVYEADVPLLKLAAATEYSRQRAAANMARMDAMNSLAAEDRNFARDRMLREEDRRTALADQKDQRRYEDRVRQQDRNFELKKYGLSVAADTANRVDNDTGMTLGEMEQVRNSPDYARALHLVRGPSYESGWKDLSPMEIINMVDSKTLKVLASDFPEIAAAVAATTGGATLGLPTK